MDVMVVFDAMDSNRGQGQFRFKLDQNKIENSS